MSDPIHAVEHRRRTRVIAAMACNFVAIGALLTGVSLAEGLWGNALGTAPLPLAGTGLLWGLRRGVSLQRLAIVAGVIVFAVAVQGAVALGGFGTPPVTWLAVLPMLIVLIAGPRSGLVAAIAAAAAMLAFFVVHEVGGGHDVVEVAATLRFVDGLMLLACICAMALAYERAKQRAFAEVEIANARLTEEIRERERVEAELRHLASVSKLAAGVAHDIATPVQYLRDTTQFVVDATADLRAVLIAHKDVTAAVLDNRDPRPLAVHAHTVEAERDLAFVVDELPDSLERMADGLERIGETVRSMRQLEQATLDELDAAPNAVRTAA